MDIDGPWTLTVETPIGRQTTAMVLHSAGASLSGTLTDLTGALQPIVDGRRQGDRLTWRLDLVSPLPLSLAFEARMEGDVMHGRIVWAMPDMTFTARRT